MSREDISELIDKATNLLKRDKFGRLKSLLDGATANIGEGPFDFHLFELGGYEFKQNRQNFYTGPKEDTGESEKKYQYANIENRLRQKKFFEQHGDAGVAKLIYRVLVGDEGVYAPLDLVMAVPGA